MEELKVDIFEMDYSVSPGGINCWEATVYPRPGFPIHYGDGKTAGEMLNLVMTKHPGYLYKVEVLDLEVYNRNIEEREGSE